MDESGKKGLVFSISEDQIREDFVNYLLETKGIPPDASTTAQILNIKKNYQLFLKCEGPYTARWGANCIWEHKEEYKYNESEIVFVDKNGYEYTYQQEGTTPVSKLVEKTGYRTVIDKSLWVDREIKDRYSEFVHAQGVSSPLYNWIIEIIGNSAPATSLLSDDDFFECSTTEQRDEEKVLSSAETNCKNACFSHVKAIIPGDRYTNFTFNFEDDFKISEECYIPLYQVEYTYNHRQYEVWFLGYEKGVWYSDKTPGNSKTKRESKPFYTASAVLFVIDIAILVLAAVTENSLSFSNTLLTIVFVIFGISIGSLIVGGIFSKINSRTSERWTDVKKQLVEIYRNQEMTLQIRKLKMEQIVKGLLLEKREFCVSREALF